MTVSVTPTPAGEGNAALIYSLTCGSLPVFNRFCGSILGWQIAETLHLLAMRVERQNLREDHWLVDFGIGRDFGLGNSHAMWTLGIRVADLRSKLNVNSTAVSVKGAAIVGSTTIAAQERTTFVGAGPRFGLQGDVPLGRQFGFDWQAGAAVLFGERTLTIAVPNSPFAGAQTSAPAIFNVDAQAGLSYWFNPNLKFTVGYRYDEYFKALKTITVTNPTTQSVAVNSIDRAYSGPMARLTFKY
jgi:hypothetical protein